MTKRKVSAKTKPEPKKAAKSSVVKKSELVAVVSDIHFDLHDEACWHAFRKWHSDVRPSKTVILGDFLDFGMLSRYVQGINDPIFAIPQILAFVKEANALAAEAGELIVVEGNHDERWSKMILGNTPLVFRGAIGLSLKEQCYAQGLSRDVTWLREDVVTKGLRCGPFVLRHGHNQSSRFGGGKHLAANRIAKSLGASEIFGHHHRAQMFCQTAFGKTAIAIANPCMTGDHEYSKDPDWQRGFTILELYGPDNIYANPYIVVMNNGHFSWNGKVYDGNIA